MKLTVYGYEVELFNNFDFDVDTKDVGVILSIYDWLCEEGFFDSNTFYQDSEIFI